MGQMHPALNVPSIVANNVSSILNQNLIAQEVSPVFTQMENQVV
jgi:glutamate/tyrosine decarboxylase-like PLP-dependent enzyme